MKVVPMSYAAIICGAVLLAVFAFYGNFRPQNSNFRRRIKEKRQKLKKQQLPYYEITSVDIDPRFREAIIINEIEIAEQLMSEEKLDEAIMHFAHAISICADPGHLLNCLRRTLPTASYDLLIQLLVKMYGERFRTSKHGPPKLTSEIATSLSF